MKHIYIIGILILCLASCRTPQISYLDDLQDNQLILNKNVSAMVLQPDDQLTIFVKSIDPQLTNMFNLITGSTNGGGNVDNAQSQRAYTVDAQGNIQVPQIGTLHVNGMNKHQVADVVKKTIEERNLAKNVTVIVDFKSLYYYIGGEVGRPGRQEITKDHTSLLEALTMAGDITISGRRDNVLLLRQEGDNMRSYRVNLTSSDSLQNSPALHIQQGDYVYVSPTDKRKRETTAAGNTWQNPSIWISIASLLTSVAVLIFR